MIAQTATFAPKMTVTLRRGTTADSYAIFGVFKHALADLLIRTGLASPADSQPDPATLEQEWRQRDPLYRHLAAIAEEFWVAEQGDQVVGFARSILTDGVRELTEFFVQPGVQASGLGGELLARAFPTTGARRRLIIATIDSRAQALYLKAHVYPRFPLHSFGKAPEPITTDGDLSFIPVASGRQTLAHLGEIDRRVLSFRRDRIHEWLLADRQAYLYLRDGEPVGYGYVGEQSGPFALLDPRDYPSVLAQAESTAAAQGQEQFDVIVPLINEIAVDYLLAHGYRMAPFFCRVMSDRPFGRFDHYLASAPMTFI